MNIHLRHLRHLFIPLSPASVTARTLLLQSGTFTAETLRAQSCCIAKTSKQIKT